MHTPNSTLRRPAAGKTVQRIPTVCVVDAPSDDYRGWDQTAEASGARMVSVGTAAEALRLARSQRVDLRVNGVLGSQHEHRALEPAGAQGIQHIHSGLARQSHVEDHNIVCVRRREPLPFLTVRDQLYAPALLLQSSPNEIAYGGIVFDDQYFHYDSSPETVREKSDAKV